MFDFIRIFPSDPVSPEYADEVSSDTPVLANWTGPTCFPPESLLRELRPLTFPLAWHESAAEKTERSVLPAAGGHSHSASFQLLSDRT